MLQRWGIMLQVAGALWFKWWMRMREVGHYASEVGHYASNGGCEWKHNATPLKHNAPPLAFASTT